MLGAAFLFLAGCTTSDKRTTNFEVRTARVEDQVAALERTQTRLEAAVDSLSELVSEQVRVVRDRRADNQAQVSTLERQIQTLQAELETARREIAEIKDQVTYSLETQSEQTPSGNAGEPAGVRVTTPRAIYDAAYQDLTRGNHALALMGFNDVLSRFPRSELADNAQYWIGETYYVQADYERALEEFRKLPISYPASNKVPDALLKAALCLLNKGESDAARRAFQELIDRFPDSEAARLADQKLGDL